jgi:flagellar hook-associated protein 1 FlgK
VNGIDITITGVGATAPAAGDSFFVSPIYYGVRDFNVALTAGAQVATSQDPTSPDEDNRNALDMVALHSSTVSNLDDKTFHDHYAEIVSTVGSMSQSASDSLEFDDNLLYELKSRRESISGVSLDEEAANLIRFQRAFEAGARIIKLTDELLELVINL